jgi:hypothetical protein
MKKNKKIKRCARYTKHLVKCNLFGGNCDGKNKDCYFYKE